MKVTFFNGSPKGKNGNTNIIIELLIEGMKEAGAEAESVSLSEKRIEQCKGCLSCFTATPGRCCINDDMSGLLVKYMDSDIVGFASPLFSCNMTGLLKNFLDRTIPLKSAQTVKDENGDFYHPTIHVNFPKVIAVSNCGFPGENNFWVLKHAFSVYNPIAEIYRNAGETLRADGGGVGIYGADIIPRIKEYKANLRKAGYEIIKEGAISQKTMDDLNKPLEDDENIMNSLNTYFESEQKNEKRG